MSTSSNQRMLFKSALVATVGYIGFRTLTKANYSPSDDRTVSKSQGAGKEQWGYEVKANQEICTDPKMLVHVVDHFNGIRVDSECLPTDKGTFRSKLWHSVQRWQSEGKRGVFLKIPLDRIHLIEIAVDHQFTIHHARPQYVMLIRWLPRNEPNMIPDHCHCYISVGCVVVNRLKEAVVIQERWNFGKDSWWKLPGGAIDRCENIHDAAVRETKEVPYFHRQSPAAFGGG